MSDALTQTYEIITLTVSIGSTPAVLAGVAAHLEHTASSLLGCWYTDIGDLNKVLVLRSFHTRDECLSERRALQSSEDLFGISQHVTAVSFETYDAFPDIPVVTEGKLGPIYEVRTYEVKLGGLDRTLQAWAAAFEGRNAVSPLTAALYSTEGTTRITHFWPYRSLEERTAARAESVKMGVWPPVGGPALLKPAMRSQIFMPAAFSPLL